MERQKPVILGRQYYKLNLGIIKMYKDKIVHKNYFYIDLHRLLCKHENIVEHKYNNNKKLKKKLSLPYRSDQVAYV